MMIPSVAPPDQGARKVLEVGRRRRGIGFNRPGQAAATTIAAAASALL